MKKKIFIAILIFLLILATGLIFANSVNATTSYNSEISYNENWDSENTITVVAAGKNIESATIPSTIDGKKVTKIEGFNDCTHLTTVSIPSTVTTIKWGTFENCTSLKNITIPSSVTTIESYAFQNCTSLTSITIPSSVTKIDRAAFMGCTNLKTVTINNGLTAIAVETFSGCGALMGISIPSSVKSIGWGAFNNCKSLTSVTVPSNVTELGGNWYEEGIFAGCTNLKIATINAEATKIPEGMFWNCTSLTNVTFSADTFTSMENRAFEKCTALTTITLPDNLTNISYKAFAECTKLATVNIGDFVETIEDQAFYKCTSLNSIKIPCGVRTIEGDDYIASYSTGAFEGCTNLRTLYFTKTIQEIKAAAFQNVDMSQLTFYGYSGTAAKYYAQDNNIKYIECTPVTSIKISGNSSVLKGKKITLSKTITPSGAFNKDVRWESSNTNIATIDKNGVVTGKQAGTVTITATAKDGTAVKATYKVTVTLTELPFRDVTVDNWYYSAVDYVYNNKMMSGTNSTTFSPASNVTRGMLVTILHNMEGKPYVSGTSKFSDVKDTSAYYYVAVKWATANNIVSGYNNGKFGPNDPITREQLAVMLNQYCKYKGKYKAVNANFSNFKDRNKISSYAKWGMNWAVGSGVISGSNGYLNPQGTASRAETAAMIYKYCLNIK